MDEKELNQDIVKKYMRLNALMMQFLRENKGFGQGFRDPSRGQGKILAILRNHPLISQKELVEQLEMQPQSASELIKKLERQNLLVRYRSETDKRSMILELTSKGRVVANEVNDFQPVAMDSLTSEEKTQFDAIMTKLIAELEGKVKRKVPQRPFGRR